MRLAFLSLFCVVVGACSIDYRVVVRNVDGSPTFYFMRTAWGREQYVNDACLYFIRVSDELTREIMWEVTTIEPNPCLDIPVRYGQAHRPAYKIVPAQRLSPDRIYRVTVSLSGGGSQSTFTLRELPVGPPSGASR